MCVLCIPDGEFACIGTKLPIDFCLFFVRARSWFSVFTFWLDVEQVLQITRDELALNERMVVRMRYVDNVLAIEIGLRRQFILCKLKFVF